MDYITAKEARKITLENKRAIEALEKERRKIKDSRAKMKNPDNILEIDSLCTYFFTDAGIVRAVDGVSFDIPRGATVGVVGESGCGKSITSLSVMRLLSKPQGQIVSGEIRFSADGENAIDIVRANDTEMKRLRGNRISMIFQEPMTSLNPVFRIGNQLDEVVSLHRESLISRGIITGETKAYDRSREMLELVGIADSKSVYMMYPHELSGGMRQRVMIAMSLLCDPSLIIADEPTTALDVTIQAQILDLLRSLKKRGNSSIMLITHDLGVIAEMADLVVVMYAGRVVERGTAEEIFKNPRHPYTIGLMKSKPVIGENRERLYSIRGKVPNPVAMPDYCYFRDRCDYAKNGCMREYPAEIRISDTHFVNCYNNEDIANE